MTPSRTVRLAVVGATLVAVAFASIALAGWVFDVAILRSIVPGAISMKRITVAALLLLGTAALAALSSRPSLRVVHAAAAVGALAIGVATLAEWSLGASLGVDTLLGPDDGTGLHGGRMAGNTAIAVVCLAAAELLFLVKRPWATRLASLGGLLALTLGFVGIVGYIVGLEDLSALGALSVMAAPTATAVVALSTGALLRSGQAAGWVLLRDERPQARLARRMVLMVAALPVCIGVARMALDLLRAPEASVRWLMTFAAFGALFAVVGLTVRGMQRAAEQERSVLEGVRGQAIYVLDEHGRVDLWNPGAEEITGYTFSEVKGKTLALLFPDGEKDRASAELREAARMGQHETEGWRVRKDGSRFWVSSTITAMRDADGTVRGYVKVARDRTAERDAADALARSKERYDLAFEASNDGIWDWDLVSNKVVFSPRWKAMLGYEPQELADEFETWRSHVHPEDLARAQKEIESHLAGVEPRYELEHRMRHKDGRYRWILSRGIAVRDAEGKPYRFVGSHTDVTARKTMELDIRALNEQLVEKARTLDAVLRASVDHILIQDREGKFLYVSESAAKVLGSAPAALVGKRPVEAGVEPWPSEAQLDDVMVTGRPRTHEATYGTRSGPRHFEYTIAPMRDGDGAVVALLTNARDVTARREAEQEARRLKATLEQRVRERTAELEAANKELEAFAYSVSHDLRAPLRAIDGFSRVILEDYRDKLDDEGRDALDRVRAASQRMGSLIDDILRLSRVSRAEIARAPVDVSALTAELTAELERQQPERDVTTVIEPGITVIGDPTLLRAVMQNFLDNAWKFTGKHASAHIEVGTTETPDGRAIYIRDDGAGFDPQYSQKLFGAFQRLHHPNEFPGNGIGLATVKRIIQRHGGKVWAEGAVEKGATFTFTIPARDETPWTDASHPSSSSRTTPTTRSSA